jgi:ubiquitin-conjugating enzyme E2 S
MKELKELISTPPEGIKIIANDEDMTDIQALIDGPGILIFFFCIHQ